LGITGGVATGKSSLTRCLRQWLSARVFDADAIARELLESDTNVKQTVLEVFGSEVIDSGGGGDVVDRGRLREVVFRDSEKRRKLEAILHPLIRIRWMEMAKIFRNNPDWLLVDIPLLFETSAESEFDIVAVVACSEVTQRSRIVSERRLSVEMADRIIAAQQSLASKMARAGHVIWNDSPPAQLEQQAQIFAGYLRERYG